MDTQSILLILFVIALCLFMFFLSLNFILRGKNNDKKTYKGIVNNLNHNELVSRLGKKYSNPNLIRIFNRAKNPWGVTEATFQFIRIAGSLVSFIFAVIFFFMFGIEIAVFPIFIGLLAFFYPLYYYKATGNEREAEWNKMYEFIWVIKHNIMLYDPAKSFLNTKLYIAEHAPHNKELIQGFQDFYEHWNTVEIDPFIEKYYSFSVPREIYQIIYNMYNTGDFPEESLNSLRAFIINAQSLTVEQTLSSVSGKATVFSLPFLMVSVIVALMVPLIVELLQFL